jgi:hypothetical protein
MLEVHLVPVSNGDSTLLRFHAAASDVNILIDGGLKGHDVAKHLQRVGVSRLNVIVASHFHWDHVGGLKVVRDAVAVGEYWTGDLRPFEEYCRGPKPSSYVLRCLITADAPLRSRNGRNRLVWDGVREVFADGALKLEVFAPPYALWERLRQSGVASGLLVPSQAEAYRKRLVSQPEPLDIDDRRRGEERPDREGEWETATPIGPEYDRQHTPLTEEDVREPAEPDMARFLSSAVSPWNDMSLVIKVTYQGNAGAVTILFPGDLVDWSYVFAYHPSDTRAEILKIPHHCSDVHIDGREVDDWLRTEHEFLLEGLERHGPSWLEHQLRKRSGVRSYRQWYRYWREFAYPLPFGVIGPGRGQAAAIPTDVLDWLDPAEAFYFPLDQGSVHLPSWAKKERIRKRVKNVYCTRVPESKPSGSGVGVSCRDCSGCTLRSQPVVLKFS